MEVGQKPSAIWVKSKSALTNELILRLKNTSNGGVRIGVVKESAENTPVSPNANSKGIKIGVYYANQ